MGKAIFNIKFTCFSVFHSGVFVHVIRFLLLFLTLTVLLILLCRLMASALFSLDRTEVGGNLHFSLFHGTYWSEVSRVQMDLHNDVLFNFYLILITNLFIILHLDPFSWKTTDFEPCQYNQHSLILFTIGLSVVYCSHKLRSLL